MKGIKYMTENEKELPVLDYDKLIDYIQRNTGYKEDIICRVLNLETDYMRELGIISCE